jgi:hypothetical protein
MACIKVQPQIIRERGEENHDKSQSGKQWEEKVDEEEEDDDDEGCRCYNNIYKDNDAVVMCLGTGSVDLRLGPIIT